MGIIQHIKTLPNWVKSAILILIALALAFRNLEFYLLVDFNLYFTLMLIPFILYVTKKGSYSIRFGVLSVLLFALYPILKIQSCFFLGFSFLMIFIIESTVGKVNRAAIFLVALSSPMANYVFKIFGFPIRLELSQIAGKLLSSIGFAASANGNNILIGEESFYVEAACVGLKMIITSMLICLAIQSFLEKKNNTQLPYWTICMNLLVTFLLVIGANLFRIIGLILFKAKEETASHEFIGIICLFIYVVVPLWFYLKIIVSKLAKKHIQNDFKTPLWTKRLILPIILTAISFLTYYNVNYQNFLHKSYDSLTPLVKMEGFESTKVDFDATKLENDSALIYIKPCKNYWSAEHNPTICWRGSGYTFKNEKIIDLNGKEIYTAELVKENDKLYTAWWFSNGEKQTISQLDWRLEMAKGGTNFDIINITCANKNELMKQIEQLKI